VKDCPTLYKAIAAAGEEFKMGRFGSHALNGLRIEKGFKLKADLDYVWCPNPNPNPSP
jgi:glycine cleavage system aminomethyltransferase T